MREYLKQKQREAEEREARRQEVYNLLATLAGAAMIAGLILGGILV